MRQAGRKGGRQGGRENRIGRGGGGGGGEGCQKGSHEVNQMKGIHLIKFAAPSLSYYGLVV